MKALIVILALCILAFLVYNASVASLPVGARAIPSHSSTDANLVTGAPSLTPTFINQVLRNASSPAQGLGETLYQLSTHYHIDDAYALAFFHHESSYGKFGMAASTLSLGNIRCTQGYTCDPTGGYRRYRTWAEGAQDWFRLIHTGYVAQGLTTVSTIIPVYAPAQDHNDEAAYINSILTDITQFRQEEVHA